MCSPFFKSIEILVEALNSFTKLMNKATIRRNSSEHVNWNKQFIVQARNHASKVFNVTERISNLPSASAEPHNVTTIRIMDNNRENDEAMLVDDWWSDGRGSLRPLADDRRQQCDDEVHLVGALASTILGARDGEQAELFQDGDESH